ncbi:NADH-quinone oxidoreductase subunit NuoG [Acidihalobacter ferrooxydans]|nr:NADH-quinone oxidoreductase subunit NuoG [Acidihalobacter ferrooxydans]
MGTFYLDERPIPFEEGEYVIDAARRAGIEIPHFCYHPALGSLGACRLCMVQLEPAREGDRPRNMASCLLKAGEGMRVSLKAAHAVDARQSVIEEVMTNHPHDCPVCDEGGECHLQNMTVEVGPPYRRYEGAKRTFVNQYLGPLIWHTMDRCITCYRCVRFYQDHALGDDLGAFGSRNRVYFGRHENGPLESPFAGNLVEVCPTGVFTDRVYRRHYSRVWDLQTAPSVCPHCSVGCNTLPGAREGSLRRVVNRANRRVNEWFICDRGRYGHRYTEVEDRPRTARVDGRDVSLDEALDAAAQRLSEAADGSIAGLGSVREDMEGNAALRSLLAVLHGWYTAHPNPDLEAAIAEAAALSTQAPTLAEIGQADAVLVAGDLTGHAPMLDFAVRQAVRVGRPLVLLHTGPAPLARHAQRRRQVTPRELLGLIETLCATAEGRVEDDDLAALLEPLRGARNRVVLGVAETLGAPGCRALGQLAGALGARLGFALPNANAFGTALLSRPGDSERVLESAESGRADRLIVLGADPLGSGAGAGRWAALRERLNFLLVLDCVRTTTSEQADIFIPLTAFTERAGTFVNYAGLAQGFARIEEFVDQTGRGDHPANPFYAGLGPVGSPLAPHDGHLPDAFDAICEIGRRMGLGRVQRNAEILAYQFFNEPPTPGRTGITVDAAGFAHLRDSAAVDYRPPPEPGGGWQVVMTTWYGDEHLALHAPELQSLAPREGVRMHPDDVAAHGLDDAAHVLLSGPGGRSRLALIADAGCPRGTLGLSRASMAVLGADEGDELTWEASA